MPTLEDAKNYRKWSTIASICGFLLGLAGIVLPPDSWRDPPVVGEFGIALCIISGAYYLISWLVYRDKLMAIGSYRRKEAVEQAVGRSEVLLPSARALATAAKDSPSQVVGNPALETGALKQMTENDGYIDVSRITAIIAVVGVGETNRPDFSFGKYTWMVFESGNPEVYASIKALGTKDRIRTHYFESPNMNPATGHIDPNLLFPEVVNEFSPTGSMFIQFLATAVTGGIAPRHVTIVTLFDDTKHSVIVTKSALKPLGNATRAERDTIPNKNETPAPEPPTPAVENRVLDSERAAAFRGIVDRPIKCDVCSRAMQRSDGYILTTKQVVTEHSYWRRFFQNQGKHFLIGDTAKEMQLINGFAREQAASATGWLVCEECSSLFNFDRATAKQCAVNGTHPPGVGPADAREVMTKALIARAML